jgi:uncharacterized protein (TIGR02246 family)
MNTSQSRVVAALAVVVLGGMTAFALFHPEKASPKPALVTTPDKEGDKVPEQKQPTGGDTTSIRKAIDAYTEAFNKGDIDALMALWAPDADYVSDQGKSFRGRAAISAEFKRIFAAVKGYKISFKIDSLRFPRPEFALEDGTARGVASSGQVTTSRYTAVWVKTDGKWLLSSVRDYPNEVSEGRACTAALKELGWLVGTWVGEGPKAETHIVCRWAPNQTFLLLDYTIKRDGEVNQVEQRIGWDPVSQSIRSWVFDSEGGFAESYFTREGNRWVSRGEGVLSDGQTASSVNTYQFVDDGHFTWSSKDRQVDGLPLSDVSMKFTKAVDRK